VSSVLLGLFPVVGPLAMAKRADGLYVAVVFPGVALVVVVLMTSLTHRPDVPAVGARQGVRVGPTPSADLDVDSLTGLNPVTVAR